MEANKSIEQTEQEKLQESAIQMKLASMFDANEDIVGTPKVYVDITGDYEAALVLDEIFYWTKPKKKTGRTSLRVRKNGVLWLAVRRAEWWERKRLTERQSDRAIEKLVSLGLVEKEVWNFNGKPTIHLRLKTMKFAELYMEKLQEGFGDDDEQDLGSDISDLYTMMGIPPSPNGEGALPNGDVPSPNGEIINNNDTVSTQYPTPAQKVRRKVPDNYSDEWKILAGEEVDGKRDEKEAKMIDAANLIAMGSKGIDYHVVYGIAYAFMKTRDIVIPESKIKSQRKPIVEMVEMGVLPNHAQEATRKLMESNMTVTDLYSISKTAIDLANKPKSPVVNVETDDNDVPVSY